MIPEKIDRYEIKAELGRGGMATVFEAYDPRFERTIALKVLPREFMHEPEFRARFTREARTIASLEHPAIVPVYDFGEHDGQPFLVMRLMTGGSLSDRLKEGPIPIDETARILERLGSALDRAHGMGIIHRDLKPSNVLFDQYGDAHLADFGIVHVSSSTNALTASGSLVGTPTYMSPEQVYGDKKLDGRSDIYALGVILFQMLTGITPYDADTPARMMMKHVMDPVPHILNIRPDLPPACDDVIHKAMAKERDNRYATAQDLTTALTAVTERIAKPDIAAHLAEMKSELTGEPATATTAEPTTPPPGETPTPPPPVTPSATTTPAPQPIPTPAPTQSGTPKWVWGIAAVILIFVCIGGAIAIAYAVTDGEFDFFAADPTATPRRSDDDDEEERENEEATQIAMEATETAAAIPTDTPEPTATDTPEPTLTPTIDVLGTRESAEMTREAENAASATQTATAAPAITIDTNAPAIYGPSNGDIPHDADNFLEAVYTDASPQNFIMQAIINNPYDTSVSGWDFGLIFRQADPDDEMRLVVRSDGSWTLNDRRIEEDTIIQEGDVLSQLDLSADGSNGIQMIVAGDIGFFFLNEEYIATLDLSSRPEAGIIALGTGFYGSDEREGAVTTYDSFGIWPFAPVAGPFTGAMDHILDDLIKLEDAGVDEANFIVETTFVNPFGLEESDWDLGFAFRANSAIKYWLIVESTGDWVLVERQGDADSDTDLQFGEVDNLNLEADGRNHLRLIVWGDLAYFFINNEFVDTLDVSSIPDSGEVQVVTAYYFDHEIEGRATGYEDFTIWPLP